jgi:cytoskeletal protein CcmA (bactofilin family)
MFSRKLSCDNFTNLIAPGTIVNGIMSYDGVLKVQGRVRGDLLTYLPSEAKKVEATIIVDAGAEVDSKVVNAMNAIVKGKLLCQDLTVEDTLRIHQTAELKCVNIFYRTLEIEPGALLHDCRLIHLDHTSAGETV